MRLFTAIDPPSETMEKLEGFLARLRPLAKLRWSPTANLHITTKFIGEWPEARLDDMKSALAAVRCAPFQVSIKGIGWFPDARRPRVFWTGVDGGKALRALAHGTEQAVAALGVAVEQKPYSPHLTLARVNGAFHAGSLTEAAGDPDFGTFEVASFFLYLSSNGKYSKLAEFPLI